jgi:hypothetical protein
MSFKPARPTKAGFSLDNPKLNVPFKWETPDGNRTHISWNESGCSIAVELRGDQGKWMGK